MYFFRLILLNSLIDGEFVKERVIFRAPDFELLISFPLLIGLIH